MCYVDNFSKSAHNYLIFQKFSAFALLQRISFVVTESHHQSADESQDSVELGKSGIDQRVGEHVVALADAYKSEWRDRGAGRPTKKERRMIERLKDEM